MVTHVTGCIVGLDDAMLLQLGLVDLHAEAGYGAYEQIACRLVRRRLNFDW